MTAAEKTCIMEIMEAEPHVARIEAIFVRAWKYTDQNRSFSPVADELAPLLRNQLTMDERSDLIRMLTKVAEAYGEPSELQLAGIGRPRRSLMGAGEPSAAPLGPVLDG